MNLTLASQFFVDPPNPQQRRYEALRAVFVEGQKIKQAAKQFGYQYGSLRNLVSQFQQQLEMNPQGPLFLSASKNPPPISLNRHLRSPLPTFPRWRIAVASD